MNEHAERSRDRNLQAAQLANLKAAIETAEEDYKFPTPVAEQLEIAWEAVCQAIREHGVDWGGKREQWEQGRAISGERRRIR